MPAMGAQNRGGENVIPLRVSDEFMVRKYIAGLRMYFSRRRNTGFEPGKLTTERRAREPKTSITTDYTDNTDKNRLNKEHAKFTKNTNHIFTVLLRDLGDLFV